MSTPTARISSGVLLLVWVGLLWKTFNARENQNCGEILFWNRRRHELIGLSVPLPFIIHVSTPGYGLLLLMSCGLAINLLVGIFNPKNLRRIFPTWKVLYHHQLHAVWLMLHVFLSTVLIGLIGVHTYTALWYH